MEISEDDKKTPQGIALHFAEEFQRNYPSKNIVDMTSDLSIEIESFADKQNNKHIQALIQAKNALIVAKTEFLRSDQEPWEIAPTIEIINHEIENIDTLLTKI